MDKKYIAHIGNLLVILGMALPVLHIDGGDVTLITYDKTAFLGIILVVLSIVSSVTVYRKKYALGRRCAIGILVGLLVTFLDNYLDLSIIKGMDLTDIQGIVEATGLLWGWIVLFVGSILGVYATTWLQGEYEDNKKVEGEVLPHGRF
ncbi:hypothetical protein [Fusobacterium sp.]|uniref:hypothetical protein n=1 Tax=Fusobacterium sp. TaxID=68766 RepID=UPI00396C310C